MLNRIKDGHAKGALLLFVFTVESTAALVSLGIAAILWAPVLTH